MEQKCSMYLLTLYIKSGHYEVIYAAGVDICRFMPVTFKELQEYNNSIKETDSLS